MEKIDLFQKSYSLYFLVKNLLQIMISDTMKFIEMSRYVLSKQLALT